MAIALIQSLAYSYPENTFAPFFETETMPARSDVGLDKPQPLLLLTSSIRTDGETQHRSGLNSEVVNEYAELMRLGVVFPPLRVWWDGHCYWLTDGFHRLAAAQKIDRAELSEENTMIDAKDLGALARAAALGVLAIGSYEYVRVEPTAHAIVACSYCQVNQQGTYGACKKPGGGDCTQDYLSTWCTAAVDYGC